MSNIFQYVIPTDCTLDNLPVVEDFSCQIPRPGEICDIIFKGTADGPTDMSAALDWTGLIDNTDATGADMKRFTVRGSLAPPDRQTVEMPKRATKTFDKIFTLTARVLDLGGANYDFMQLLEAKRVLPNFYFITLAGWMFGKVDGAGADNGIIALNYDVNLNLAEGEIESADIVIQFRADTYPDRVVSPL